MESKKTVDLTGIWYTNFTDYEFKDLVGKKVVYQWGEDYDHMKMCVSEITKSSFIGFRIKKNPKLLFDFMGHQKYPFLRNMYQVSDVYMIDEDEYDRLKEKWKKV